MSAGRIFFTIIIMIIAIILMKVLMSLGLGAIAAAIITAFLLLGLYMAFCILLNRKRVNLMDEKCDPDAFLARTKKQKEFNRRRNRKTDAYLDIDTAAGLITSGKFEEAKEILLAVDKSQLSYKNGSLSVYTINLMSCYYALGEIEQAEELFEKQIPLLPPVSKKLQKAVEILVAERLFYLKRYSESREYLTGLWKSKRLSRRNRLETLYYLARMDEIEGNKEKALKKYRIIADNGNKLWIAKMAREKVKQLDQEPSVADFEGLEDKR